jgi:hypothetical protein
VVDIEEILVEASYKGPTLTTIDDLNPEWIVSVMEWHKDQKKLHKKFATMII